MSTFNLSRSLRWNATRRAEKEALVDGDLRLTYAELDREVDTAARALRSLGVGPGDVVAILRHNSARYVIELFAVARLGAVSLPLNWRLAPAELSYILTHSQTSFLLVDEVFTEAARAVSDACPLLRAVVTDTPADTSAGGDGRRHGLAALLAAHAEGEPVPDVERDADDLQRVLYTSGTTSHPKGVMISHGNAIWNHLGQITELELTVADRILLSAPLFHVSGLDAPGLGTLYLGATLVITRSYGGSEIAGLVERERVTGMVLAVQIVNAILALPDFAERDLSSLRYILFGGFTPAAYGRLQDALPHVRLIETFAMTELTNGTTYLDAAHSVTKRGSQGTPFPHTDVRIVDAAGSPVPPGTVGEITVRGPKVTLGYYRDPEATAKAYRDGWFHTGDMGRLDADGYLWFADRAKDMIKSGGENISSAEVERVVAEHPAVAEVAVVGVPDEHWGEVPKAIIVLHPARHVTPEEIGRHCEGLLARYKVPRQVEIVASLPRNDSGKILKRVLRPAAGEEVR